MYYICTSIGLIAGFILYTVFGTLSHELGHYAAGRFVGLDAQIHYASTSYYNSQLAEPITWWGNLLLDASGPLQTMITGSIGLTVLMRNRISYVTADRLSMLQWGAIGISLFWLRQPANLAAWLGNFFITGRLSGRGDEIQIARLLGFPDWSLAALTALIGFGVLFYVVFFIIPKHLRLTFMISGLVGGVLGYYLWLQLLGPIILP